MLSVMHVQAGGCGGCALELELVPLHEAGLAQTTEPRHADLLLVSGAPGKEMMRAVESAWAAMAEPKWLVAVGDCAINGGPFAGSYAGCAGIGTRLPMTLSIPGNPPSPDAILAGLLSMMVGPQTPPASPRTEIMPEAAPSPDAELSPSGSPAPPALLPAAPRRPLAGDGSSGS